MIVQNVGTSHDGSLLVNDKAVGRICNLNIQTETDVNDDCIHATLY